MKIYYPLQSGNHDTQNTLGPNKAKCIKVKSIFFLIDRISDLILSLTVQYLITLINSQPGPKPSNIEMSCHDHSKGEHIMRVRYQNN